MTRLILLSLIVALSPACTLDFEEFRPYTPGQREPDSKVVKDGGEDDAEVDAEVDAEIDAEIDAELPDSDGDGVPDGIDNCPEVPNPPQTDTDGDGIGDPCDIADTDGDGHIDDADNCPAIPNEDQLDADDDGLGDVCDPDQDGDGLDDAAEAALGTDPTRADSDGDGSPDGEDACPLFADRIGLDTDGDGRGDACDMDDDGDGVFDWDDPCPRSATAGAPDCGGDLDGDGLPDASDNCPTVANPDQGLNPCAVHFETLTYDQDLRDVARVGDEVLLAGSGGLMRRAPDGVISRINSAKGIAGHRLQKIFVDASARIWVTHDRGLSVIRPDGLLFNIFSDDGGGRPMGALYDIVVDGLGQIWVSSEVGLNVLSAGRWATRTTADQLPSDDVRGLHLDAAGRIWVATAAGLAKVEAGQLQAAPLGAALGALLDVADDGEGGLWVFGEAGIARLDGLGAEIPGAAQLGITVLGVGSREGSHYLLTNDGIQRLDPTGRLYPPSSALLPGAPRAIVGGGADDPYWIATSGGGLAVDGYFASFSGEALPQSCVRDSARFDDVLWLATSAGLFRSVGDEFQAIPPAQLPSPDVRVLRAIGLEIWVGTTGGVSRFDAAGTLLGQVTPGIDMIPNAPISDVVRTERYTWLSTLGGGLARQPLDPPAAPWETFNAARALDNYTSDQIRALAFDGQRLWAGTDSGLMIFDEESDTLLFPISEVGARLPSDSVNDVLIIDGEIYAATDSGVAVGTFEGSWTSIQRVSQDVPNIPIDAGTDTSRAISYDGEFLWILLGPGRGQDFGSLVRWDGVNPSALFTSTDAGLLETQSLEGASLNAMNGELFINHCGVDGGFTLLDGAQVVTALVEEGLPGDGAHVAITESASRGLLFTSEIDDTRSVFEIDDSGLIPLSLPASITALPVDCAMPLDGAQLWCILEDYGVSRYIPNDNPDRPGTWSPFELLDTIPTSVASESNTIAWVGTTTGITLINSAQINRINSAMTNGGLPGDDVRMLRLSANRRLYVATEGGVGIYNLDSRAWTPITEEIDLDTRAVAPSPLDQSLWIGTGRGLFRYTEGQPIQAFGQAEGVPSTIVHDIEIDATGRVYVATEVGVLRGPAAGPFELLGFADGLPGQRALDLVITADGTVWVRSDDGLAKLL